MTELLTILLAVAVGGLAARVALQNRALRSASEAQTAARLDAEQVRQSHGQLMQQCGVAMLYVLPNGHIVQANALGQELLGIAMPAAPGASILEATLSEDVLRLIRAAAEAGTWRETEVRVGPAGRRALIVTTGPAIRADGQTGAALLLRAVDVTALRRLETVRRDFVANVSHEMRTPLASIRAMAETLQSGAMNDPEVSGRFLQTVIDEANRLTRITDDLLVLADAESQPPLRTQFDLHDLVHDVLSRFGPTAQRAGVSLTVDVPTGLHLDASYDLIEQVTANLLDNGIKYTHAGGSVSIHAKRDGDRVAVAVRDTGIGIMQEHLPRLFERFYRVDKARSRKSGGTGLGLSIVKRIVEAHGGEVTVASEYNHGSTFTFTIPISPASSG